MKTNKKTLQRIVVSLVFPHKMKMLSALVAASFYVGLSLYAPVLSGNAVDNIISPGNVNISEVIKITVIFGLTVVFASICQWLTTYLTNIVAYTVVKNLRLEIFRKITSLSVGYIDSHPHGDIISRVINDVEVLSDGLLIGFSNLFTGFLTIFATIGFMISIDFTITLSVVLLTPLSLFVAWFIAKNTYSMFKLQSEIRGRMSALTEEAVGGAKTVKMFGQKEFEKKMASIGEELRVCGVRALFFSAITNPATRFVNNAVYALVGILGAFSVIRGGISVGQLACFLTYANQYTKPFNEISNVISEFTGAIASAERIFNFLDEKQDEVGIENSLKPTAGDVSFSDISFSYSPEKPLISGFSCDIKEGSVVAIVGPTGCGKTTLINLLMRFYDVTDGEITINKAPIKNINLNALRLSFGMVLQDTWLKNCTVAENIAYGKIGVSRDDIVAAAEKSFADGFISRLPDGYDTIITEDGGNLSQGQRQLLCISRVMLNLPPMLILDEATSSIDTMTELRIRRVFDKMTEHRTSFIVAHRLSTIVKADVILVMNNGEIIERGNHKKLLEKGGFYKKLYESQFEVS